ncbi:MAG TPA: vWA domain-containing protein [Spirochaetota bacterium]|nr:vWA domain-containing protein [Spirochaetota bacterium]HPJ38337.1 vWA domain-containing protein [Spirochaetota bacterium]HPQ53082.1 vWA domain-containing protein [Spirochaetota bacterium]
MKFFRNIMFVFLAAWFFCDAAAAEIAVVPYKIENPSSIFPVETGAEYAKLLSVAAIIRKELEVYSPRDIDADIRRKNIDPQGTVTEENLYLLGKSRYLDHVLIGSLFRKGGQYVSESLLYSVRDRKVLVTARVQSPDLFELAEKEIQAVFTQYNDVRRASQSKPVDAAFVIDMSYNVAGEWDALKRGISRFASVLTDGWSLDARITIVPFSKQHSGNSAVPNLKTAYALKKGLERLRPGGGGTVSDFETAMLHAVKSIPWRGRASKVMTVISNSPLTRSRYLENYAYIARKKNITIYTVSLGKMSARGRGCLKDMAVIGNGDHYNAAYHQRVFDARGGAVDLFMEDGRLFESDSLSREWKQGLFHYAGRGHSKRARTRSFLKEIFYNDNRYKVDPYTLKDRYEKLAGARIINTGSLETNISDLMPKIAEKHFSRGHWTEGRRDRSIARVLLEDGRTTLWIHVHRRKDLDFFRKKKQSRILFPLGVVVERKTSAPFGVALKPEWYLTGLSRDYIPDMMKTSLEKLIQSPDHYTGRGLYSPPVWFLEVKVGKILGARDRRDIRE